jgi:hypothetical protein
VLSVLIIDLQNHGVIEVISVLSILMLTFTFITVAFMQKFVGRDILGLKE